ncbi:TetR/AcrR family transcriptional regulator [Marinomonas pontica]
MRTIHLPCHSDQRKQCIIDATKHHVLSKGFHKASMSEIAKTAELSVGQIYRYFAHKDDIICALVEQFTQRRLHYMASFLDKKDWLERHFSDLNPESNNERIMHAEIKAEAARNPTIAQIYKESHQRLQKRAINIMAAQYPNMDQKEIAARIEMLVTLSEGLLARWEFQPRPFSQEMRQLYSDTLDTILPD